MDQIRTGGPDYDNCLVNLANSILKGFGAETSAATLPAADQFLAGGRRNVVLLLLDAMGSNRGVISFCAFTAAGVSKRPLTMAVILPFSSLISNIIFIKN